MKKGNIGFIQIPYLEVSKFFNRGSSGVKNRSLTIFKLIEINEQYHFNVENPKDNYTKGYKIKDEIFFNILKYNMSKNYCIVSKDKYKVKRYIHNEVSYNSKKEIQELYKMSRKELDQVELKEYYSLISEPIRETKIPDNLPFNINFSYMHTVVYDKETITEYFEDMKAKLFRGELTEEENGLTRWLGLNLTILEMNPYIGYQRGNFGRLFNQSQHLKYAVLQNSPKSIRKIMFKGQFEYDINTSVASILLQHQDKIGLSGYYPYIKSYIEDKQFYRDKLLDMGFDEKSAKQYFTSLFFGVDVENLGMKSKLRSSFSQDELDEILRDDSNHGLVVECLELYNNIKNHYKEDGLTEIGYKIKNEQGCTLSFPKKDWKKFETKVVPHIYQGIESVIIDAVLQICDVNLILFDAFITLDSIDLDFLSNHCYDNTGYYVKFEKTVIG